MGLPPLTPPIQETPNTPEQRTAARNYIITHTHPEHAAEILNYLDLLTIEANS